MLYNKDQEVILQGSGGYTTRISRICLVSVLLSASVERCFDSRMRDISTSNYWPIVNVLYTVYTF